MHRNNPAKRQVSAPLALFFMLGTLLFSVSAFATHHADDEKDPSEEDIMTTLQHDKRFSTLVSAIEAAGISDILRATGEITVFAPTNEAFEQIPADKLESLLKPENKEKLVRILSFHVVEGIVNAEQAASMRQAESIEGTDLDLRTKGGKLLVQDAMVDEENIMTNNGIIHAIDKVLMP